MGTTTHEQTFKRSLIAQAQQRETFNTMYGTMALFSAVKPA